MSVAQSSGPRTYGEQSSLTDAELLARCRKCAHYVETQVFTLCQHPASKYKIGTKEDWHTIGHLRSPRGSCGEDAKLFKEKA